MSVAHKNRRDSFPWTGRVTNFTERTTAWCELTQDEREWIVEQSDVMTNREVATLFHGTFSRRISWQLVDLVVKEGALPEFAYVGEHHCPGCGGIIISSPCVLCTVNRLKR